MSEVPEPERGSDANYCSAYPVDGHHMVSRSAGKKVRWVEICSFCGWIDTDALDAWADNAFKESLSKRAARIGVAVGTQPFAFVQPSTGELDLQEILTQALASSYAEGQMGSESTIDAGRLQQILARLQAEIDRVISAERAEAVESMGAAMQVYHEQGEQSRD